MSETLKSTNIASPSTPAQPASHKMRFPPFPAVPEGVTIVPFKDFEERGIRLFRIEDEDEGESGEGVERDGLGIPTVALRAKHATDFSKTKSGRGGGRS
ncbi:hypothetical protein C8R47DRAFT_170129 [Mycena vitilis]|nr:hypothetical protein C8R47DRAFT_170129 [Mycena vitilis]